MRQVSLFFNVKIINKCYKVLNEIIENPCNPNNTVLIYKKIETRYCRNITRTVKNEITTDVSKLETAENFCRYRIRLRG